MIGHDITKSVSTNYYDFATEHARGRSDLYEQFCLGVSEDPEVIEVVERLPLNKRQPNYLLAAVRYLSGVQPGYPAFRKVILENSGAIVDLILERRIQTNEPARCATLLPALSDLPQPLAMLELGSSAGLALLPDMYGYDYGSVQLSAPTAQAPMFACKTKGDPPIPSRLPDVVWRTGIDLNPLDVNNDDDMKWLTALLWPGEGQREPLLHRAIAVARTSPPTSIKGDFVDLLADVAATAPKDATLVVFHSVAAAYVDEPRREQLFDAIRKLGVPWISMEVPGIIPDIDAGPKHTDERGALLIVRDGKTPLAYCDSHGAWMRWL
jgi:hypothetical protein